jgi:hypothetical protein
MIGCKQTAEADLCLIRGRERRLLLAAERPREMKLLEWINSTPYLSQVNKATSWHKEFKWKGDPRPYVKVILSLFSRPFTPEPTNIGHGYFTGRPQLAHFPSQRSRLGGANSPSYGDRLFSTNFHLAYRSSSSTGRSPSSLPTIDSATFQICSRLSSAALATSHGSLGFQLKSARWFVWPPCMNSLYVC